jgi:hypothetical protein
VIADRLNTAALVCFVLGIVCLGVFMATNLGKMR